MKSPDFGIDFGYIGVFIAAKLVVKTMSNTMRKPMCNTIFDVFFAKTNEYGHRQQLSRRGVLKRPLIGV